MKKTKGKFILLDLAEFAGWIGQEVVHREVIRIQNHHTFIPSYAHFHQNNHFALMESMESAHLERGFSEIAQNLTTFPDGSICVGRPLDKIPAGIKGANRGGICIENVGNFDTGRDLMTQNQEMAIIRLNALLCQKFRMAPSEQTIIYHHWYDLDSGQRTDGSGNTKSCPGTAFFGGNTVVAAKANFLPRVAQDLTSIGGVPLPPVQVLLYRAQVTADALNVREQPNAKARVLQVLSKGVIVNVCAEEGSWRRIHPAESRWASGRFLQKV